MVALRRLAIFSSVLVLAGVSACKKDPPPPPTPVFDADSARRADSIEAERRRMQARQDSINRAEAARRQRDQFVADSIAAARAAAESAARDAESMRMTISTAVHYDFDKADLREDTRQALDQKIPILTANPSLMIRIAGHTDSRGSGEYNLQLGQRRAAAARDYLQARGVSANRIELVSYGEERPVCQSQDEGCWSQNRRAEFEITAGGSPLRRP